MSELPSKYLITSKPLGASSLSHTDELAIVESQMIEDNLLRLNLVQLNRLCLKIIQGEPLQILSAPLTLVEFEMLEAELRNQGILPKTKETISQNLEIELTHLQWLVRNHLKENEELLPFINVPNYLFKKTISNIEILTTLTSNAEDSKLEEFKYFEQLAAYINGEYEEVSNPFEKGLNVVLKTIRSGTNSIENGDSELNKQIKIILPVDRKNLIKQVANNS